MYADFRQTLNIYYWSLEKKQPLHEVGAAYHYNKAICEKYVRI